MSVTSGLPGGSKGMEKKGYGKTFITSNRRFSLY